MNLNLGSAYERKYIVYLSKTLFDLLNTKISIYTHFSANTKNSFPLWMHNLPFCLDTTFSYLFGH